MYREETGIVSRVFMLGEIGLELSPRGESNLRKASTLQVNELYFTIIRWERIQFQICV